MPKQVSQEDFIRRSIEAHGPDAYDLSDAIYVDTKTKILVRCKVHGTLTWVYPSNFMRRRQGCKTCRNEKAGNSMRMSQDEFVRRCEEVHGPGRWNLSRAVYVDYTTPVTVGCPVHETWGAGIPSRMLAGLGACRACRNEAVGAALRQSTPEVVARFRAIHGNRYDYSRVRYVNAHTSVTIGCRVHGWFPQLPSGHWNGKGCHQCSQDATRLSQADFEERARQVHSERYGYAEAVYVNYNTALTITCPEHGPFPRTPKEHIWAGMGCQLCGGYGSAAQRLWLEALGVPERLWEKRVTAGQRKLRVDAYDPETRTVYEFWGDIWHGNPLMFRPEEANAMNGRTYGQLHAETQAKRAQLLAAGYRLVEIWESDWQAAVRAAPDGLRDRGALGQHVRRLVAEGVLRLEQGDGHPVLLRGASELPSGEPGEAARLVGEATKAVNRMRKRPPKPEVDVSGFPKEWQAMPRSPSEAKERGARHYFSGVACKHGHVVPRYTANGTCLSCMPEHGTRWREENPAAYQAALTRHRSKPGFKERNRAACSEYWYTTRKHGLRRRGGATDPT